VSGLIGMSKMNMINLPPFDMQSRSGTPSPCTPGTVRHYPRPFIHGHFRSSAKTEKSRAVLTHEYGKRVVDQSLSVWSTINKSVERDVMI